MAGSSPAAGGEENNALARGLLREAWKSSFGAALRSLLILTFFLVTGVAAASCTTCTTNAVLSGFWAQAEAMLTK
jgi:hypothetical protein